MNYTLWEFRSPSNSEVIRSMRHYEGNDRQYQHEYQKILWQGEAISPQDAWFKAGYIPSKTDKTV